MAEQGGSGKRTRSRKNISLSEKEKLAILDTVAKSDRPVAEVLRELGISRSTYYSWLKRYEGGGAEGLKDKREQENRNRQPESSASLNATPPGGSGSSPYADTHTPSLPDPKEPEAVSAPPVSDEPVAEAESGGAPPAPEAAPPPPMGGGAKSRSSFFLLMGIIVVVAGLILTLCMYNSSGYFFKMEDGKVTLWKGKFAPFGKMQVKNFTPVEVGSLDLAPVLGKRYYGEWSAVNALVSYMLKMADRSLEGPKEPNYDSASRLLSLAEKVAQSGEQKHAVTRKNVALKYRLVQKRISQTEQRLADLYKEAVSLLERMRSEGAYGVGDVAKSLAVMKAKADEMNAWITDFAHSKAARPAVAAAVAPKAPASAAVRKPAPAPVPVKAPAASPEVSKARKKAGISTAETTKPPKKETKAVSPEGVTPEKGKGKPVPPARKGRKEAKASPPPSQPVKAEKKAGSPESQPKPR